MPGRLRRPLAPLSATDNRPEPLVLPLAVSLGELLALNPRLSLGDILALWHVTGPSRRLH